MTPQQYIWPILYDYRLKNFHVEHSMTFCPKQLIHHDWELFNHIKFDMTTKLATYGIINLIFSFIVGFNK
jgi:hypothetical protein